MKKSSSEFVFVEFVFAIRLRNAIRLRGIRLRNSSSWGNSSSQLVFAGESSEGNSSSGNSSSQFVFGIRLRLRVEMSYPHSGLNAISTGQSMNLKSGVLFKHESDTCGLCFVAETALISKLAAAIVSEVVADT